MTNRLNIDPVGIKYERAIIIGMIAAEARWAVASGTRFDGGFVKGVNLRAGAGRESDVHAFADGDIT